MIIPFTLRGWLNTGHGVLFGGGYIVLLVLALMAVTWLRPAELRPAGRESTRRQVGMTLTAAAAVAWITVVTGTWGIYPWFRADTAGSATSLLLARRVARPLGGLGRPLQRAWIAWTSTGLVTLAAAAGFRGDGGSQRAAIAAAPSGAADRGARGRGVCGRRRHPAGQAGTGEVGPE